MMGAGAGEMPADHPDIAQAESLLGGVDIEVLNSHAMSGNWSGDIDRGFVGKLVNISAQAMETIQSAPAGDQLDAATEMAVRFVADHLGGDQLTWFPDAEEILNPEYRVFILAAESEGEYLDSARLLITNPGEEMVFYGWVKF